VLHEDAIAPSSPPRACQRHGASRPLYQRRCSPADALPPRARSESADAILCASLDARRVPSSCYAARRTQPADPARLVIFLRYACCCAAQPRPRRQPAVRDALTRRHIARSRVVEHSAISGRRYPRQVYETFFRDWRVSVMHGDACPQKRYSLTHVALRCWQRYNQSAIPSAHVLSARRPFSQDAATRRCLPSAFTRRCDASRASVRDPSRYAPRAVIAEQPAFAKCFGSAAAGARAHCSQRAA